ncbi:MAG TPA: aldo/keto reductase [Mycobacteriales bacterium]|nr:aldo/keto reductase [Mycobacteriales bacterium]
MLAMTTFDNTGMKTTRVGFGAWAIGGGGWKLGWGEQDDADSVATIRAAIERGINWIDTAAIYGHGRSEQVVAEAIAGYPAADRPYICTKCGRVWDPRTRRACRRRSSRPRASAVSSRTPCAARRGLR